MKHLLAALVLIGFASTANAVDLVPYPPAPPVIFKDANKPCQQGSECEAGYCLADANIKGHGVCRDRKYPGFGCMTLYDKEKGAVEYCND